MMTTLQRIFRKGRWVILTMIILLLAAVLLENHITTAKAKHEDVKDFRKTFLRKQKQMRLLFENVAEMIENDPDEDLFELLPEKYFELYKKRGLALFIYNNDSLVYWSDNNIPVPASLKRLPHERLNRIGNSIFIRDNYRYEDYMFTGLILIKTEYPYENKFLQSGFQKNFRMNPEVRVIQKDDQGENAVYDLDGEYLFSLDMSVAEHIVRTENITCIALYFLLLVFFLFYLRLNLKRSPPKNKNRVFLVFVILLTGLYIAFSVFRLPKIITDLELFSPEKFAQSAFLPSLGDLLILSVIGFFIIYNFFTEYHFNTDRMKKESTARFLRLGVIIFFAVLIYLINAFVFRSIILDSTISFETYKVLDISVYTFLGFLILLLLFATYGLLIDKLFQLVYQCGSKKEAKLILLILFLFLVLLALLPLQLSVTPEVAGFYALTAFLIYYFRLVRRTRYRFSTFAVYILLFSIFTVFEVVKYTEVKNQSEMKMLAVNLSAEHDPVAELLLVDVDSLLREDDTIPKILFDPYFDYDDFYGFIQRKYFNGYWDKYDLQITICQPSDSVYVRPPEDSWYHCYNFFYEYILEDGIEVPNTDFYYLDNLNGRISYFSSLSFEEGSEDEVTVFIELDSRLMAEGLGYPGLLLEDRLMEPSSEFSYAKYSNNRLITSSGEFAYPTAAPASHREEGFQFMRYDGWDHKIYNIDGSNTIIVSKPSIFWIDILISFSYTFGFYFIILIVLLFLTNLSPLSLRLQWNFKNKIQVAMTSLLFFSLLLIGAGTVYFSIKQYRDRQTEILNEKIQSVYVELIHKLEYESDLHSWTSDDYYHLNELLKKFSNVFYSDINLFDENGRLLASSRPEIFEMGLVATRMNSEAFLEMAENKRSEFIHNESIGKLKYLSAYVPFVNIDNKLLAYLNLPYFTRQDELTREVTNLVVAIINIVVLLSLLSFTIAVIMSNRITHPLRLLQENLARISLSEKNEKINYQANDEIGSLVNEYNQMVEQLLESAELLARSERESAWREMAKQIAHEIKNPLTPMKLGIQHLQRIWAERGEEKDPQVDRIARTLIEQIDNLSAIATEFSNFAKMPLAKNARINIVDVLKDSVNLFEEQENTSVNLELNDHEHVYVFADKEQMNRVFINLIKNGLQSIPESRKGRIDVSVNVLDRNVIIRCRDNGKGIHPEIRDKLFQPNFTTKSSGMGMGLAIVQNIIRNARGKIYYETELNKGTSFYIQLPITDEDDAEVLKDRS